MAQELWITEGPQPVGVGETVVPTLTTTNWGSSPSSPTVAIYNANDLSTDLAGTMLTGSASESGDVITLPAISGFTTGNNYVVKVTFTTGSSTLIAKALLKAET